MADAVELEARTRTAPALVRRLKMPVDSMADVLAPGVEVDVVPVEDYAGPGIYFLELDGRPDVARVHARAGGSYLLVYANEAYPSMTLQPAEGAFQDAESGMLASLKFLGRVQGSYHQR